MDTTGGKLLRMVVILCAGLLIIGGVVALVIYGSAFARDASLQSAFAQYQTAGQLFKGRIGDYGGVCGELVLAAGTRCRDSAEAFRVSFEAAPQMYYCTDDTGFTGTVSQVPMDSLRCE